MNNNPLYSKYQKLAEQFNALEKANYDSYKVFPPATEEEISNWEIENNVKLPPDLRYWYLLSNGLDMSHSAELLPITSIKRFVCDEIEELEECYIVGHYIGDGSMLVIDNNENFYEFDHAYCKLHKMTFEAFLTEWVEDIAEDCMYEAGILK